MLSRAQTKKNFESQCFQIFEYGIDLNSFTILLILVLGGVQNHMGPIFELY